MAVTVDAPLLKVKQEVISPRNRAGGILLFRCFLS
jgi:hypothetical protein